jgi:2,3-dihydroxy-p-cumate/2,3-dihydroxybenzoate 3,4-dioxygenase
MLTLCEPVYAHYGVTNAAVSARFAETMLGLQPGDEPETLRAGPFGNALAFHDGADRIGIEIVETTDLDKLAAELIGHGFAARKASAVECTARRIHAGLFAKDATGNNIELVTRPQRHAREAPMPIQNFGLRGMAIERDVFMWTKILGARVADRVGDITYLGFDALHHRIALYPANAPGLLYTAFGAPSLDDIMAKSNFLRERQVRIVQGPGRQTASSQIFLHIEGPEHRLYSYVFGISQAAPARPRQFARDAASLCSWGSVAQGVPELAA